MTNKIKFGTDGWRAIIAEDFTFENVELVTKAIAAYIKTKYDESKPVIIGYDTRFMADRFAKRSAEILNDLGLDVLLADSYAPTPVIAYSAKNLNTAGALMFTASHNPPEYLGIKYIPDYAGPATEAITDIIVANVKKLQNENLKTDEPIKKGTTEKFDPKPEYMERVKQLIDLDKIKQANINIFFDPLYATALGYFDTILKDHDCKVTTIHDWTDPLYGGGMPEPKPKYLGELIALVKENANSVGFSNDGDADRFGVIDENGNYVTPNEVIAVLLKHLIKNKGRKGGLVRTVAGSLMLDKIAKLYGDIKVFETPVGFKWVGEVMRNEEIIIGGEESGGLSVWGHIPEKDGIVANLSILEAMAYENKHLYELVNELKKEIGTDFINHRIDLHLTEEKKKAAMEMFLNSPPESLGGLKIKEICKKDGVKYYFDDENSWMLVRASGTEPLLRVYFETDTHEKLEKFVADVKGLI